MEAMNIHKTFNSVSLWLCVRMNPQSNCVV